MRRLAWPNEVCGVACHRRVARNFKGEEDMRLLKVPWKESAGGVYDTDSWQYNLVTREKGNHQKPVFNTRRWNKFHRKREDLESFSLVYISFGTCKIRRLNPAYITEGNEKN